MRDTEGRKLSHQFKDDKEKSEQRKMNPVMAILNLVGAIVK